MSPTKATQELDLSQVRALLSVFRKNEWRGGMNPLTQTRGGAFSALLGVIALNIFFSLAVTAFVIKAPDLQTGLTVGGLFILVIVAFQVLLEFGKTIIAPEDYSVIAPLPVSSRTFYVAKQIHFLMHVTIITLALSLAPIIGVIVVGKSIVIGFEALVVFWLSGIIAGQLVSIVYTLLLRTKRPERIERILGYAQMALSLSFTMMYFWFSRLARILETLNVDTIPAFKLAPSYWFTAFFRLILEGWRIDLAIVALSGALILWALYVLSANNLSMTYAQSLLQTGLTTTLRKRPQSFPWVTSVWRRYFAPETRAVLTLMKAQFRGDARFRMQTLVMIPMLLVLFLFLGAYGDPVSDPFGPQHGESGGVSNLFIIVMLLPMTVIMSVFYSSSYKAAWIFYTSPVSRRHMLTGARTIALVILLAPLFIGLTMLFTYLLDNLWHAILHALFVTSIVSLPVALTVLLTPGVPFSLPMAEANKFSVRKIINMFMLVFLVIPVALVERLGYGGYLSYSLILGSSLLLGWALEKTTDPYLERRFKTWEFLS